MGTFAVVVLRVTQAGNAGTVKAAVARMLFFMKLLLVFKNKRLS